MKLNRFSFDEGYTTDEDYPEKIKPTFNTLGSIIKIEPGRGWQISFVQEDTLGDFLALNQSDTQGLKSIRNSS